MNSLDEIIQFLDDMRASGDYSAIQNVPKELLKNKDELNKLTAQSYKNLKYKKKHNCLYPNCTESPIDSHSIQKAIMKTIADETGHLQRMTITPELKPKGKLIKQIAKVSYNDASVFEGFCNNHDTSIFLPIEKNEISLDNKEQMFLILYRSVCREYVAARNSWENIQNYCNSIISPDSDPLLVVYSIRNAHLCYCEYFWIEQIKEYLDSCLVYKSFEIPFKFEYFELDYIPILVNTFFPVVGAIEDISYYPDVTKEMPLFFSLTSFPKTEEGKLGFFCCYFNEHEKQLKPFLRNLHSEESQFKKRFVSDLILRNSDNFYLSTSYWNRLAADKQNKVLEFFCKTIYDRWHDLGSDINFWG